MVKAKHLLFLDGVKEVKNDKQILYNVVLENGDKMIVNNMISETLNPNHSIAKLYVNDKKQDFDAYKVDVNDKIIDLWNKIQ